MSALSKRACLLAGCILIIFLLCILMLILQSSARNPNHAFTACIYQDGQLVQIIPLDQVRESYTFTLKAADGGSNTIEVSPGGIAVTQADCPDLICVRQGRITDSLLPITCLPHRLVIELQPSNDLPDALTY